MTKNPTKEDFTSILEELNTLNAYLLSLGVRIGEVFGKQYEHILTYALQYSAKTKKALEDKMHSQYPEDK